ncbi:hypothetical protein GCM10020331_014200 [Ectobacillus funiculus]
MNVHWQFHVKWAIITFSGRLRSSIGKTEQQRGWRYAYDNVMNLIHPGSILLLHSVSSDNAEALSKIIDDLRKRGYQFKSLDDLVREKFGPEVNY